MIILGIDPGTARIGWGIIDVTGNASRATHYGCITTEKEDLPEIRLLVLHNALRMILEKYTPDCVSVEQLFFSNNAKTAMSVGQARGIILLAAAQYKIPVVSYTPLVVKQAIAGSGKADKRQVQLMITRILKLKEMPKPDDVADALAIALTHAYTHTFTKKQV